MKIILTLTGILFLTIHTNAKKEIKYPVDDIPANLRVNAKAVVRYEERGLEFVSDNSAKELVKFAVTILNENGYSYAYFHEFYDKFIKIQKINATVYSSNGEKLHKIKSDDIYDVGAISGISIYDDNRMKTFEPNTKDFPFTIEYSYEREYKGIFSFPSWKVFKGYNVSVEKAVYWVRSKNTDDIRIKQLNFAGNPQVDYDDDFYTKTWEFTNFTARKNEAFSKSIYEYTPVIQLAPSFFNISGNKGECNSWKLYGDFIANLNKGRNDLSEETKEKVRELTKDATTDYEKVKLVYEYMQNKTRYVSIQVGMGGWQPFEASVVDRLGYGDCKALSYYMKSLLEAVEIESVYTLVYAGESSRNLQRDFPSNQFNHAILCVPLSGDTLWLECTNQELPCGYISDFTDDRDVLLIKENGSHIAHTKAYTAEQNERTRTVTVLIDSEGNGSANVQTKYTGLRYSSVSRIFRMDKPDQKKYMLNRIDIPNFYLEEFEHELSKGVIPFVNENISLLLRNYASKIGNRLVLPLNLMNKQKYIPSYTRKRESEIVVRRSFIDTDEITYKIPEGFELEKIPEAIVIDSPYGYYEAKAMLEGNSVIYSREIRLNKGEYPAESYNDFRQFYEKVSEADEMKCLLARK